VVKELPEKKTKTYNKKRRGGAPRTNKSRPNPKEKPTENGPYSDTQLEYDANSESERNNSERNKSLTSSDNQGSNTTSDSGRFLVVLGAVLALTFVVGAVNQ